MIYHPTPRSEIAYGPQLRLADCGVADSVLVIQDSSDGFDPTIVLGEETHQVLVVIVCECLLCKLTHESSH